MRYLFAQCRLDTASRELLRDGEHVHLSPKAFLLLTTLVEKRPRVLTKSELMTLLWPDAFVVEANLPVVVAEVRAALGDHAATGSIKTHHGVGYSFVSDVRELPSNTVAAPNAEHQVWLKLGHRTVLLAEGANVIGRDPAADVFVNDASVSRQHARLVVTGVSATVEDLGSKNGTFVRGQRVGQPAVVAHGDELEFGHVKATFVVARLDDPTTMTIWRSESTSRDF
jgi:DNA-binding winged helix-turn-helix (wHTH) protein